MVCREPTGQKYEYACRWGIQCVRKEWVLDSVEKKFALPSDNYTVKPEQNANAVCEESQNGNVFKNVQSCPSTQNNSQSSQTTQVSQLNRDSCQMEVNSTQKSTYDFSEQMKFISDSVKKVSDLFLEGSEVALHGFESKDKTTLKQAISRCGGTYADNMNKYVTHVIVPADCFITKELQDKIGERSCHLGTLDWFCDCLKQQRLLTPTKKDSSQLSCEDGSSYPVNPTKVEDPMERMERAMRSLNSRKRPPRKYFQFGKKDKHAKLDLVPIFDEPQPKIIWSENSQRDRKFAYLNDSQNNGASSDSSWQDL